MGLVDRIKSAFNRIFRRNQTKELENCFDETVVKPIIEEQPKEEFIPLDLPEGEIVPFDEEVIDTESPACVQKLKHNLEVLVNQAKEKGKVDKFMIIREDDFFPEGWEWRVLSKNTNLEKVSTRLSYELRKAYALEQSGIPPFRELMGTKVPNGSYEETLKAMSKIDKTVGNVMLPSRFRSTKHFTVNTPLGVTGDYNSVSDNRDYIIIDNMDAFLALGYGYSVAYHDAYLDVSHESLPISEEAVVLINDEKYEKLMQDEKVAKELAQRRVVRFKGDEVVAIDMILSEMGALSARVGSRYATYDQETFQILEDSMKSLAEENGLFYDKSHAGQLTPNGGHFSNYYDDRNKDYEMAVNEFSEFLRQKFPEQKDLISSLSESSCQDLISQLGTTALLDAIDEYNKNAMEKMAGTLEAYKEDRATITPEVHQEFVDMVSSINDFYKTDINYDSYDARVQTESAIQKFLQGGTVADQLEAAKSLRDLLPRRSIEKTESPAEVGTISMKALVANAVVNERLKETELESVDGIENSEKEMKGENLGDR